MSATADTPVQEKIEVPGDVGQPGVAPSGHNQMGDHGPALERGIARIPDPDLVCNSDPVMHVVGEAVARLPIASATMDRERTDYPPPRRPSTRNPDCKTLDQAGLCALKCCSQFNACVYALRNGDMDRGEADVLLGYEAAAAAAALKKAPHARGGRPLRSIKIYPIRSFATFIRYNYTFLG